KGSCRGPSRGGRDRATSAGGRGRCSHRDRSGVLAGVACVLWCLSLPNLPGRIAARPERLEAHLVTHGVHALPEAVVLVGHELAVARQAFQRLALEQRGIAVDVIEDARLENEEGAVDPCLTRERLLVEARHAVAVELQAAEARRRAHGGYRCDAAVAAVELQKVCQVDVGDT